MGTLKEEIKPVGSKNTSSEIKLSPSYQQFWHFWSVRIQMQNGTDTFSKQYRSESTNNSIVTFSEVIKPVVSDK